MPQELDISAIADQVADKTALAEANRPRTIKGGNYRLHYADHKVQLGDGPDATPYVHFQADAIDLASGERRGVIFFNISGIEKRNPTTGKLTKDFKLFANMVKALEAEANPVAVIEAFRNADVTAFVTETMQSPEKDKYLTVGRDVKEEEVADLLASGYTLNNYVQNIGRLK